jgi:hypothetical protein
VANINDLGLRNEELPLGDIADMPSGFGSNAPVPQPGIYRFRLPSEEAIMNCFEVTDSESGQILTAIFKDEAFLFNETLKQYYSGRVNSRIRMIGKGEDKKPVSDFALLLKAVKSLPEHNTLASMAQALTKAAGRTFIAEHQLTATCNPQRDIYQDGKVLTGKKGCGARYGQEAYTPQNGKPVGAIPVVDGMVATRFTCECGAELRAWGQLRGFRS